MKNFFAVLEHIDSAAFRRFKLL